MRYFLFTRTGFDILNYIICFLHALSDCYLAQHSMKSKGQGRPEEKNGGDLPAIAKKNVPSKLSTLNSNATYGMD